MLASETPTSMNRSGYLSETIGNRARSLGEIGLQANHVGILLHQFAERLGVNDLQIHLVKKHITPRLRCQLVVMRTASNIANWWSTLRCI